MWAGCSGAAPHPRTSGGVPLCHIIFWCTARSHCPHLLPHSCRVPIHPPVFPQTPWPDNWDAYSDSLYIVFPLYRVGSGLEEMVVGTTRKPSSLEVNFVTLFMICKTDSFLQEGLKPKPLGKSYSYISIFHCHQLISAEKSNGTDKVQRWPPQTSVCAATRLWLCCYPCTVISLASSVSVCLLCSGPVQWGSALFEKREKSLVPVGDALSSSGGLTAVGPRRPRQGGRGRAPLVLVLVHQLLVNHSVHVVLKPRTERQNERKDRGDVSHRGGRWWDVRGRCQEIGLADRVTCYRDTTVRFHLFVWDLISLKNSQ